MRKFVPFALMLTLAAPAGAQQLGERTATAEELAGSLGRGDDLEAHIAAQAQAASAHPLGSVENPVRVGGPAGERAYLARLRCAGGGAPEVGARAEAGIGPYGSVVAGYAVSCGAEARQIVFDMYHEEHVETRAPAGFTLAN